MNIITLTLNPCVDDTYIDGLLVSSQSGGKGVNAARVLTNLGVECAAVAPYGGANGARFLALAEAEGVNVVSVPVAAETRVISTYICDGVMKVERGESRDMSEGELDALRNTLRRELKNAKLLAVCGSACGSRAAKFAFEAIAMARDAGVGTLLDSNGLALTEGARAKPDMLKLNAEECAYLLGRDIPEYGETEAAEELAGRGFGGVLITLGARGAILYDGGILYCCPAPKVKTVNAVGSGDTFTAAYIYALLNGMSERGALAFGCAAGAANAAVLPAARVTLNDIKALM